MSSEEGAFAAYMEKATRWAEETWQTVTTWSVDAWKVVSHWCVETWQAFALWVTETWVSLGGNDWNWAGLWDQIRSGAEAAFLVTMVVITGALSTCTAPSPSPPVPFLVAQSEGLLGFRSRSPYDFDDFISRSGAEDQVIEGELLMPEGTGPFPAMVFIHGSGGISPSLRHHAERFQQAGIASFLVDSFSSRGVSSTVQDQIRVSEQSMIADAYAALNLLSTHPRIDSERIGIIGFSKGGTVAAYSASQQIADWAALSEERFALHLALYPFCNVSVHDKATTGAPIRMLLGQDDDYTPARHCLQTQREWASENADIEVLLYPKAGHGFDNPVVPSYLPDVVKVERDECRLEIGEDGITRSPLTGGDVSSLWQRIRYLQQCGARGASFGGGKRQAERAAADVLQITKDVLFATEIVDPGEAEEHEEPVKAPPPELGIPADQQDLL